MPCDPYQDALIEAAASGLEPQGELRAHLAACPECRTALAQEQSLFSSIDSGLHVAVNVEIPASLLPRVRTGIAEKSAVTRGWIPSCLALAGAAAMVVALVAMYVGQRFSGGQTPVPIVKNTISPARDAPPRNQNLNPARPAVTNSVPTLRTAATRKPGPRDAMPEVLVPRDQETLLVSYAEQWNRRKRASLVAANFDPTNLSLLQIVPIQIDQLDVKLMTEEQSQ
jgi:anti-sigma factor RsiW